MQTERCAPAESPPMKRLQDTYELVKEVKGGWMGKGTRRCLQWSAVFFLRIVDQVLADVEAVLVAGGIGVFGCEAVADGDDGEVCVGGVVF